MDVVAEWSERIARRVTPDEIDFAADVGGAYAAGGASRRRLFSRAGAEPGGFGLASAVGELPVVLGALAATARALRHLLGTQSLNNALAIAALLISLRVADRPPPGGDERTALAHAYTGLRDRLIEAGFPPPRAERLARELIEELLSDAVAAEDFLRRLEGNGR